MPEGGAVLSGLSALPSRTPPGKAAGAKWKQQTVGDVCPLKPWRLQPLQCLETALVLLLSPLVPEGGLQLILLLQHTGH